MNFSVSKNEKPDELPSGGFEESRNHIIRPEADPLHPGARQVDRGDNYARQWAPVGSDRGGYNSDATETPMPTALKRAHTCQYL